MLLQLEGLIQIIVTFRTEKNICTFLSSTTHPFQGHKILDSKYCVVQQSQKKELKIESLHFLKEK